MQNLLLPLLLFLAATVMLIFGLSFCGDRAMRGQVGMTLIAAAIAYVASGIACRQQSK